MATVRRYEMSIVDFTSILTNLHAHSQGIKFYSKKQHPSRWRKSFLLRFCNSKILQQQAKVVESFPSSLPMFCSSKVINIHQGIVSLVMLAKADELEDVKDCT